MHFSVAAAAVLPPAIPVHDSTWTSSPAESRSQQASIPDSTLSNTRHAGTEQTAAS